MRGLSMGRLFGRSRANDSESFVEGVDPAAPIGSRGRRSCQLDDLRIRWLIERDIPEVLRIEQAAYTDPWSENAFRSMLSHRDCIAMVAAMLTAGGDDRVVGHMVYQFDPRRIALRNVAVHPLFRGQGVGTRLVERLKDKLHPARRTELLARVWERNLAAQLFFRAEGFRCRAIEHDAFRNGDAAYVFTFGI